LKKIVETSIKLPLSLKTSLEGRNKPNMI